VDQIRDGLEAVFGFKDSGILPMTCPLRIEVFGNPSLALDLAEVEKKVLDDGK
jgi:hypothetical protein